MSLNNQVVVNTGVDHFQSNYLDPVLVNDEKISLNSIEDPEDNTICN